MGKVELEKDQVVESKNAMQLNVKPSGWADKVVNLHRKIKQDESAVHNVYGFVTKENIRILNFSLMGSDKIKTLDFSRSKIAAGQEWQEILQELANLLRDNPGIVNLELSWQSLQANDIKYLAPIFKVETLKQLDLSWNDNLNSKEVLSDIANYLKTSTLKFLKLNYCNLSAQHSASFLQQLHQDKLLDKKEVQLLGVEFDEKLGAVEFNSITRELAFSCKVPVKISTTTKRADVHFGKSANQNRSL